ncbi:MAG TPA: hypothetical protein VLV83_03930 [Acidobacteriota bacterium]|nr:hypothetical protein [Acidobacteriota bacterium]
MKILSRIFFVGLLAAALTIGLYTPLQSAARAAPPDGFKPCPFPPCLAPCVLGADPDVICLTPSGQFKTTFACCCCGSGGNYFRPL